MPAEVTIVIVSWNTRELLDACLRSMHDAVERGLADVWVVDNGSTDGSAEMVRERHPWATVHVPERNLGYGPGVNAGARATTTPWVLPSNADIELEPGALDRLLAAGRAHPEAGVLGPRLILPHGSTQPAIHRDPGARASLLVALAAPLLGARGRRRLGVQVPFRLDEEVDVEWLTGAFLLVRRAAWDTIGGFDESVWMYAEDLDLCWRARPTGWAIRYVPPARGRPPPRGAPGPALGRARPAGRSATCPRRACATTSASPRSRPSATPTGAGGASWWRTTSGSPGAAAARRCGGWRSPRSAPSPCGARSSRAWPVATRAG